MSQKDSKSILSNFMLAPRVTQSIYVVTLLSIPDIIGDSLMSIDELARKTDTSSDALYRVMRLLVSYDIFVEKEERCFKNNETSLYLTKTHPDSFRDSVIYRMELGSKAWDDLLYSVQTGKPAFDKKFGMPFFQYVLENPDKSELFNRAMNAQYRKNFKTILENYDLSFCKNLVDIGGGNGGFLAEFLKKYPEATAVLFDLPSAINEFDHSAYAEDIMSRLTLRAGNFFESVPEGGDAYVLKNILHDWNDEEVVKILRNIAERMKPQHSRLLIIETILPENDCKNPVPLLADLQMLVLFGGRERTRQEYVNILNKTGYNLDKVYDLSGGFNLIEASLI